MESRICQRCRKTKTFSSFRGDPRYVGGFNTTCKACANVLRNIRRASDAGKQNERLLLSKHIDARRLREGNKVCSKCKEDKPIQEFWLNKHASDGFSADCKICAEVSRRRYRNSPRGKELERLYKIKNADRKRELNRLSAQRNYVKRRRSRQLCYQKNPKPSNYQGYKVKSKAQGLAFEMTYPQFLELIQQPCVYCGGYSERGWNGVDRIDSGLGYVQGNMSPCCKICNTMKMAHSVDAFYAHIDKIVLYRQQATMVKHAQRLTSGQCGDNSKSCLRLASVLLIPHVDSTPQSK